MPELALNDDQRHALAGHLDGVRVAQLVRRKASPHTGLAGDAAQLGAGGGGRLRPSARGAVDDTEQRPNRQLDPGLEPGRELLPGPVVHADLAAAAALPRRTSSEPRRASRSASASASASQIRSPARHSTTINPRKRRP